ncbi:MAG: lamin tail domain-containing protein [Candidatus Saccharibacteria bacterium]
MHKLYVIAIIIFSVIISLFIGQISNAISPNIVISQVQLGNAASASNEFIQIYNNSSDSVEITNWCLYYASASSTQNGSKLTCFTVENDSLHIYLPGHGSLFAISNQYAISVPSLGSDFKFSATLSGTAGHVRLVDNLGAEVDKVGWGATAASAEGNSPVALPTTGKIMSRKIVNTNQRQDTDVNGTDFEAISPDANYAFGLIYEVQDLCINIVGIQALIPDNYQADAAGICSLIPIDICIKLDGIQVVVPDGYTVDDVGNCTQIPVDVCLNLDGMQLVVPSGYGLDENSNCQPDVCQNIDGLQLVVPENMEVSDGNCAWHDECLNLPDIQADLPNGYKHDADNNCVLYLLPLKITELLPNATGSDNGNEFIEIYNSNDADVELTNYVIYVGTINPKMYSFPIGLHISPHQYLAFYNTDIEFTLVNTTSQVRLSSIDGVLIDETPAYDSPGDGMAWALIDGVWQYTNQPTPNDVNLPLLVEITPEVATETSLLPCPSGQYRNPDTNRCRLIVTTASTLAPCADGQYRSETTNRCRSIASDVVALVPCAEGQERNPDTNRCRSVTTAVLGTSDLTPCKEGQERNPDTNRCRNVVSAIPDANYAPVQTTEPTNNYVVWWSLAGVGAVAIVYGLWEWRHEIVGLFHKITRFRHFVK